MTSVAVIIPYYQKKPGILRRALESVLAQVLPKDLEVKVILVDDGSPSPVEKELEGLVFAGSFSLELIKQENAGVAAARNAGLKAVSADTDYIAFLDSDDIWAPAHLSTAVNALERGYDFYFCDTCREGGYSSCFDFVSLDQHLISYVVEDIGNELSGLSGRDLIEILIKTWPIQTPTVVFRSPLAEGVRFDESLHFAAEDRLFFMQVFMRSKQVCFSRNALVECGDGIGLWHNHYGWDNPTNRFSCLNQIWAAQEMIRCLSLSNDGRKNLKRQIKNLRRDFAFLTLRWLIRHRKFWHPEMCIMLRRDKMFMLWLFVDILIVSFLYPLKLYIPLKHKPLS